MNVANDNEDALELPEWLEDFFIAASDAYEITNPSDRALEWHWNKEVDATHGDHFEVTVHPTFVEIAGKPYVPTNIHLDLMGIIELFERVDHISWTFNGETPDHDDLAVEGRIAGNSVTLWLKTHPPADAVPVTRLLENGAFEDIPENGDDGDEG